MIEIILIGIRFLLSGYYKSRADEWRTKSDADHWQLEGQCYEAFTDEQLKLRIDAGYGGWPRGLEDRSTHPTLKALAKERGIRWWL